MGVLVVQEMGMAGPTWRQLHGRGLARP